jgi:peptidoglycan/xylan/chitin deacetylase (PgdA/CDA1 family)/SAM-dependent methyltransferase
MTAQSVSVIMPAFDAAATLDRALGSVRAQTNGDWEAVVVDDGSADATAACVAAHAAEDPRITLLCRPHEGVSRARNAAIAAAGAPWLLFLDADDWLAPEAIGCFLQTAAEHPDADCVHAGWTRVPERGDPVADRFALYLGDESMFDAMSSRRPFAINAAMVRTDLVREVGGFDPALAICEDWDLWLRLARAGARFRARDGQLAFFRTRARAASAHGPRMLADGLRVIDRAHAPDPRVRAPLPAHADGAPSARRGPVRLAFACFACGLVIGGGEDAGALLAPLADGFERGDFEPGAAAAALHAAIPLPAGAAAAAWWSLPAAVVTALDAFLRALERTLDVPGAERQIRRALEELAVATPPPDDTPDAVTLGRTHVCRVDLNGPLADVSLPAGADRLRCLPRRPGCVLAAVTVPAADGLVPADVLLDACVAPNAWDLLEALLAATGVTSEAFAECGWTLFLRELWGRPDWEEPRFYDPAAPPADEPAAAVVVQAGGAPPVVELLDPLADLAVGGGHAALAVEYRLAGEPLGHVHVTVSEGRVTAQALLAAISTDGAFELCRAFVRGVLAADPTASGSPRAALAAGPRGRPQVAADTLRIGRRAGGAAGTAASRRAMLPLAAADLLRADAGLAGEPVTGPAVAACVRYDPALLGPPGGPPPPRAPAPAPVTGAAAPTEDRHAFEALFAAGADPWSYASAYETTKYEQTLSLIPAGARDVLELACAEGHFTERLARHVQRVEAVDISAFALERARERCQGLHNVRYRRADLFGDPIPGVHDVIVCSEVLYFAGTRERLRGLVEAIAGALEPGGVFVHAHAHAVADDPAAPGFDWDVPFGAAGIESIVRSDPRLHLETELRSDHYRIQRYRRVARRRPRWRSSAPPVTLRRIASADAIPARVRGSFLPAGGAVRRADPAASPATGRLPVLMYHRVAADGAPAMRRWRVTPTELEEQLAYLRSAGYRSASLSEWRAARQVNQPLPGRAVALTFDDGYADFETDALPLLERYGFGATVFVVTARAGDVNRWDEETETVALMGWDSLRRVAARPSMEIGGHSATHPRLTALDDAEVVREIAGCRTALTRELGAVPKLFAAPYGLRDRGIDALAGACGFEVAVTTRGAHATRADELLALPRLEVTGGMGLARFVRLLAG